MADFQTLGAKGKNEYLKVFVEGLGTKYIEKWVGKHDVNLVSVVQLSAIAAAKLVDKDDKSAIEKMTTDLYAVMLKRLEDLGNITRNQRGELQDIYSKSPEVVDAFMPLALETAYKEAGIKEASTKSVSKEDKETKQGLLDKLRAKQAKRLERALEKKSAKQEKKAAKDNAKLEKHSSQSSESVGSVKKTVSSSSVSDADDSSETQGADLAALFKSIGFDPDSPAVANLLGTVSAKKLSLIHI